jgi:hypothetical protein
MEVQINIWAVLLATASSMAVGAFWYARPVFGNVWIKAAKVDPKKMESGSARALILTVIMSFLTAYVIAHVAFLSNQFFGHSFIKDALTTAFWLWLGLTAARLVVHDLFEGRPTVLTLLNVVHEFVTIMIMAFIIGAMKP